MSAAVSETVQYANYSSMTQSAVDSFFQAGAFSFSAASTGSDEATDTEEERKSGEYPAYVQAAPQTVRPRSGRRASRLRGSLLQAIQTGHNVYIHLSPAERDVIHGRGRKLQSFRKIAESSQMATSTLWRALSTYLLFLRHPEIAEYVHLGVGHISVVLSVEEEYRLYFLRNAEVGKWSRRKLDDEVKFYHAYRAQRSQSFEGVRQSA